MRCPYCSSYDNYVSKTEQMYSGNVRRHRKCSECGRYFTTVESITAEEKKRIKEEKLGVV